MQISQYIHTFYTDRALAATLKKHSSRIKSKPTQRNLLIRNVLKEIYS